MEDITEESNADFFIFHFLEQLIARLIQKCIKMYYVCKCIKRYIITSGLLKV